LEVACEEKKSVNGERWGIRVKREFASATNEKKQIRRENAEGTYRSDARATVSAAFALGGWNSRTTVRT